MDLASKFEIATCIQSISIRELVVDKKYSIVHAKRIVTKIVPATLFNLHVSDSAASLQIFMQKRYSEVISEDDVNKINNNLMS